MIRRASQLIEQLEDCERRHQRLQRHLLRSRSEFRLLHSDQLALAAASPSVVDIERELLRPLLEVPLVAGDRVASLLVRVMSAPRPVPAPDLSELAGALCEVPIDARALGTPVDDDVHDLVDAAPATRFDDATWDGIAGVLDGVDEPVRLSALVSGAEAADDTSAAAHLLALRVLHAFDPGLSEVLRSPGASDASILVVVPDGTCFASRGLAGDDPWLARAWLTAPASPPEDPWGGDGP